MRKGEQRGGALVERRNHQAQQRERGRRVCALPEPPAIHEPAHLRVPAGDEHEIGPARERTEMLDDPEGVYGMEHGRVVREHGAPTAVEHAAGDIGVVARNKLLVEAVDALERVDSIEDIGRRIGLGELADIERPGERAAVPVIVGVGRCTALHDDDVVRERRQPRREPAGLWLTVIVGERDDRCTRGAPTEIALRRRRADRTAQGNEWQIALAPLEQGFDFGDTVVHDDHLELHVALLRQSVEASVEQLEPIDRGDHHADVWAVNRHRTSLPPSPRRSTAATTGGCREPERRTPSVRQGCRRSRPSSTRGCSAIRWTRLA